MGRLVTRCECELNLQPCAQRNPLCWGAGRWHREQISVHLDDSNLNDSGGSRRQVLTQATRCWSGQLSHWGMSICRTGAFASVMVRIPEKEACKTCSLCLLPRPFVVAKSSQRSSDDIGGLQNSGMPEAEIAPLLVWDEQDASSLRWQAARYNLQNWRHVGIVMQGAAIKQVFCHQPRRTSPSCALQAATEQA